MSYIIETSDLLSCQIYYRNIGYIIEMLDLLTKYQIYFRNFRYIIGMSYII